MGTINHHKKHIALKIQHRKKEKVRKLMAKAQAADPREREALIKKIQRVAPYTIQSEAIPGRK